MARTWILSAISLFLLLLHTVTAWADVEEREECFSGLGCHKHILIHKEISWGDADRLRELLQGNQDVRVYLDSPGGSVGEALEIGRLLREHQITAVVDSGQVCFSACPLALAGAPERILHLRGKLGIHRPSLPTELLSQLDATEADIFYRELYALVAEYLDEMRMPRPLFEAMLEMPINDLRYLSIREAMEMGLVGLDPVTYDLRRAALVAQYDERAEDLLRLERARIQLRYQCVFDEMRLIAEEEHVKEHRVQGFAFAFYWDSDSCPHSETAAELEQASSRLTLEMLKDGHDIVQLGIEVRNLVDFTR